MNTSFKNHDITTLIFVRIILRPGVTDSEEACDDGNAWGGDGCDPACALLSSLQESEPNDSWDAGQALTESTVDAALTAGDIDCFTIGVAECYTVSFFQAVSKKSCASASEMGSIAQSMNVFTQQ